MTEPEDTCRPVEVNGETIRVRGSEELTPEGQEGLAALVRVAKAKLAADAPEMVGQLQNRLRLAHQARRAKEHQLDDIRRALCDVGFMEDDDPFSHADLADVIRQIGQAQRETPGPAATEATEAASPARELIAAALYEHSNPGHRWADAHPHDRTAYGDDADAVLAVILPSTQITAGLARDSDATVKRVITLHEQWVKAGPPPLGGSIARWWDARLAELHNAVLPPTETTEQ